MSHRLSTCLLLLSLAWAMGCDGNAGDRATDPGDKAFPAEPPASIAFADTALEGAVRTALGQTTGPLAADTLLSLERLSAQSRGIVNLGGIEHLQRLEVLDLADNRISDLTPLAGLTRLKVLDLTGNQVQDLSPLAGLDSLQSLALAYNPLDDLAPLLGLGRLQWLEVLGITLNQAAQEIQLPALQQRGVEISLPADAAEQPKERPDPGTRITYVTESGDYDGTRFFTMDPHDGSVKPLAALDSLRAFDAEWSPDGTRIAFAADAVNCDTIGFNNGMANVSCRNDLYLMAGDASSVTNLTHDLPGPPSLIRSRFKTHPCWSPDGTRIAFLDFQENLVWVIDVEGGNPRRLIPDKEIDWRMMSESLSPQWDRIAFLSGDGAKLGTSALYVSDIDGTNWVQLVDAVVDHTLSSYYSAANIAWTPDGRRISFMSNRDGNRELYVVNVDGSNLTRLTHDGGEDRGGAWSPDGRWLAFDSSRETWGEVFIVDREGNHTTNLTNTFGNEYVCDWDSGP